MSWHRHSDSLSWSMGHLGKGYLLHNGTIKTWNVDPYRPLDQREVWQANGDLSPIALNFEIDPDGGVVTAQPTTKVQTIVNADPQLYDAGQRPVFEDDFDLEHFEPKPEKEGKPDMNFIMSSALSAWHFGKDFDGYTNWDTSTAADFVNGNWEHDDMLKAEEMVQNGATVERLRDWMLRKLIGPYNKRQLQEIKKWNAIPLEERQEQKRKRDIEQFGEEAVGLGDSIMGGDDQQEVETPDLIDPELVNWQEIHDDVKNSLDEGAQYERQQAENAAKAQALGIGWNRNGGDDDDKMRDAFYRFHGAIPEEEINAELGPGRHHDDPRHEHRRIVNLPFEHIQQLHNWADHYGDPRKEIWDYRYPRAEEAARQELLGHGLSPEQVEERLNASGGFGFVDPVRKHFPGGKYDAPIDMNDPGERQVVMNSPGVQKLQQEGYNMRLHELYQDVSLAIRGGSPHPYVGQMVQALQQRGYSPEEIQGLMQQKWRWDEAAKARIPVNQDPPVEQWAQQAPDPSLDQPGDTFIPQGWTSATNWEHEILPGPRNIQVRPQGPAREPNDIERLYQEIGEAMQAGDRERAMELYQLLPEAQAPVGLRTAAPTHTCPTCQMPMHSNGWTGWTGVTPEGHRRNGWQCPGCGTDLKPSATRPVPAQNMLAPAVELREWLADLGGEEAPAPPSIHHRDENDLIQAPPVSPANDLPYFPPANIPKEYKQSGMTPAQEQRQWEAIQQQYPHQPNILWQDPEGWSVQEHNEPNAVAASGNMMANCWQGATTPEHMQSTLKEQMDDPTGASFRALHDPNGIPRTAFFWQPGRITLPMGRGTNDPKPEHAQKLWQWASTLPQMPTTDGYAMTNGWPNYSPATEGYQRFLERHGMEHYGMGRRSAFGDQDEKLTPAPDDLYCPHCDGQMHYSPGQGYMSPAYFYCRRCRKDPVTNELPGLTGFPEADHQLYRGIIGTWRPREEVARERQGMNEVLEMGGHPPMTVEDDEGMHRPFRTADSPITQADATNDPLGKNPAIVPSRQGDPDYLEAEHCPGCHMEHRADEPCPDSAVRQYQQAERQWYDFDPNALHGGPDGLDVQQADLSKTTSTEEEWEAPVEKSDALDAVNDAISELTAKVAKIEPLQQHPENKPRKLVINRDEHGRMVSIEEV